MNAGNGKRPFWQALFRPSTLRFLRAGRQVEGYGWFDRLHGYVYARWPYLYIGIGTGEHPLAKRLGPLVGWIAQRWPKPKTPLSSLKRPITFADTYHGKVMPLEAVTRLVTVREEIKIAYPETVLPYQKARDLILQNPDHIIAMDCPCRSSRPNPCLPLDVCLIVGEPFASFVAEHHSSRSRWLTSDEAVAILKAEDARGHVHHAFFKDAMLGRFYAICNCCACCCGAMHAQRHGTPMLASSGYVCQVDETLCIGCGDCTVFCPFDALSLDGVFSIVDLDQCMGCGVCVGKCPQEALSLRLEPSKGEPLEIDRVQVVR